MQTFGAIKVNSILDLIMHFILIALQLTKEQEPVLRSLKTIQLSSNQQLKQQLQTLWVMCYFEYYYNNKVSIEYQNNGIKKLINLGSQISNKNDKIVLLQFNFSGCRLTGFIFTQYGMGQKKIALLSTNDLGKIQFFYNFRDLSTQFFKGTKLKTPKTFLFQFRTDIDTYNNNFNYKHTSFDKAKDKLKPPLCRFYSLQNRGNYAAFIVLKGKYNQQFLFQFQYYDKQTDSSGWHVVNTSRLKQTNLMQFRYLSQGCIPTGIIHVAGLLQNTTITFGFSFQYVFFKLRGQEFTSFSQLLQNGDYGFVGNGYWATQYQPGFNLNNYYNLYLNLPRLNQNCTLNRQGQCLDQELCQQLSPQLNCVKCKQNSELVKQSFCQCKAQFVKKQGRCEVCTDCNPNQHLVIGMWVGIGLSALVLALLVWYALYKRCKLDELNRIRAEFQELKKSVRQLKKNKGYQEEEGKVFLDEQIQGRQSDQ